MKGATLIYRSFLVWTIIKNGRDAGLLFSFLPVMFIYGKSYGSCLPYIITGKRGKARPSVLSLYEPLSRKKSTFRVASSLCVSIMKTEGTLGRSFLFCQVILTWGRSDMRVVPSCLISYSNMERAIGRSFLFRPVTHVWKEPLAVPSLRINIKKVSVTYFFPFRRPLKAWIDVYILVCN